MPCGLQLEAVSSFLFIKTRLIYEIHVYVISLESKFCFFPWIKLIEGERSIWQRSKHSHLLIGKSFLLQIFLYGGYSKEVSSEKSSEKGIVHADLWSLDPRTWEWNKVCNCSCTFGVSSYTVYMKKVSTLMFCNFYQL